MSCRAAGCSAGFPCLPGPRRTILQLTRETAPQEFDGKPHGASVLYSLAWDDNAVIERDTYVSGKRHGLWVRSGMHEGESKDADVDGVADGPLHYAGARYRG